jgi:HK97 family phage prohead protease
MPYYITDSAEGCEGWATIKGDGEVLGCHSSKQDAIDQMVALSLAEEIEPGGERALPDNYRPALAEDVPEGRACGNCAFYNEDDVQGDKAWCERWDDYVSGAYYCNAWQPREDDDEDDEDDDQEERAPINPDGYSPTSGMKAEAQRGLDWRSEFGRGGTEIGIARARDIVNGKNLPFETVQRMVSFFARHEVDKQAEGFSQGEDGYPSNGRIAWALWGGDEGKRWAENISDNAERKENKNMAIEYRQFHTEIRQEGDGHTFEGYAAIFDAESEGLAFREVIRPGAFSKSVAAANRGEWEVKALQDHDPKYFLGSTKTGTLSLQEDDRGLKVRVSLNPEVTFASDLAAMLRRDGAAMGMSFGFSVPSKGDGYNDDGVRELKNVRLHEVSLLTGHEPAYPATVGLGAVRALSQRTEIDAQKLMRAFDTLLAGAPDAEAAETLDLAIRKVAPDLRENDDVDSPKVVVEVTQETGSDEAIRAVPFSVRERQLALAKLEMKQPNR